MTEKTDAGQIPVHAVVMRLVERIRSGLQDPVILEEDLLYDESQKLMLREFERQVDDFFFDEAGDCPSCGEGMPRGDCPQSKRVCGHHCTHTWTHDSCCWCKQANEIDA